MTRQQKSSELERFRNGGTIGSEGALPEFRGAAFLGLRAKNVYRRTAVRAPRIYSVSANRACHPRSDF
jgi:hypothetical protein